MRSEWFLALVPDGTAFDPVLHKRLDIDPDDLRVTSPETAGRTLVTIVTDVEDPGLEMLEERTWCHLSRELADGSLFHVAQGWIDPITLQQQDEDLVSLDMVCSPRDWDAAVAAAVAPLKVFPAFDPVLVPADKRDDPTEILDGYSRLVHCHPSTHAMSVVDILGVDLPIVEIDDPDWPGPQPDATTRPIKQVDVTLSTEWIEKRNGLIAAGNEIEGVFEDDRANTLTPDAFEAQFPREGSVINGDSGYTVRRSLLVKRDDLDPVEFPRTAGPVRGSSGTYNYVVDPNLVTPEPQEFDLERAWYDLELDIAWRVAQKRVQVVRFSLVNGSPTAEGGSLEVLDLRTEDISVDDTTPLWEPGTDYEVDDVRRVGSKNWKCTVDHHSAGNFGADLFYSLGGGAGYAQRWVPEATDASPLGNQGAITYFHTERGWKTIEAAALKARAMLAASIRNRPYRFETELTDELLALTTAHVVKVRCPAATTGWLQAKVTEIEISSNAEDEIMSITVSPAAGSGVVLDGADPLSQTGEAWDRIVLDDIDGQEPTPFPLVGGTVSVDNKSTEQLDYVQERDYSPADGRDDPKLNDPIEILKEVPTTIVLSLTQLSGREAFVQEIDLVVWDPWSGPKQYGA